MPHLQVTLLVQKGVGTRSHAEKGVGTTFPRVPTPLHPCLPQYKIRENHVSCLL